jgi:hypothetical protein
LNVYPVSFDYTDTVRLGLTALPNAAADAAGGLPVSDAGGLDIDTLLARLDAAITTRSSHSAADVWAVATRVLTANTNLNDPTAAAIRAEIDSNSTQLAAIVADTNELQTDDIPGLIAALNDPTAAAIASAVTGSQVEAQGTYTLQQAISVILAVCAGVTSDSGATIASPNGSATRVAATTNGSNERTAMTLTPSS